MMRGVILKMKTRKTKLGIGVAVLSIICVLICLYQASPARCTKVVDISSIEYGDIYAQYEEFELGENQYGMLVFKHPEQAQHKAMELCADVLEKIKKNYHLAFEADNSERIHGYLSYGDQMTGLSEKECRQVGFLGMSVSICEHSKGDFYGRKGLFRLVPPEAADPQ